MTSFQAAEASAGPAGAGMNGPVCAAVAVGLASGEVHGPRGKLRNMSACLVDSRMMSQLDGIYGNAADAVLEVLRMEGRR
jgi:hypothetical protein